MIYADRRTHCAKIEKERKTKVITFVPSDRQGMETAIAQDCIDLFVDLLDKIGPVPKISLILHTNGGSTLAAWRDQRDWTARKYAMLDRGEQVPRR